MRRNLRPDNGVEKPADTGRAQKRKDRRAVEAVARICGGV